jgi:hypothetical protein
MIEQAQARQRAKGLTNLTWLIGDAVPLLFPDASFSVVVTLYFLDPKAVLAEMGRVCQAGEAPRPVTRPGSLTGGDADRIRQTFADDIGVDRLGVGAHRRDGAIHFAFPIGVIAGQKQAADQRAIYDRTPNMPGHQIWP